MPITHTFLGYMTPAPNAGAVSQFADWAGTFPKKANTEISAALTSAAALFPPNSVAIHAYAETGSGRFGNGVLIIQIDAPAVVLGGLNHLDVLYEIASRLKEWRKVKFRPALSKLNLEGGGGSW